MVHASHAVPQGENDSVAPRTVRHVVAVAGGRGGVGTSSVAINLGVYLARLGRTVVLVDAGVLGAELHTMLGAKVCLDAGVGEESEGTEMRVWPTFVPGLLLMPQLYVQSSTAPLRPGRKALWAKRIRHLKADHVILDLGSGTAPASIDLCLGADLGICVAVPEPPSVEGTYRFLRALFVRRLRRSLVKDRFKMRLVERALSELPALPPPIDVVRVLSRYDSVLAELAASELVRLQPRLVVNGVRLRTDADLGPSMGDMAQRFLGVSLDPLGQIEQDDSMWLSVVRKRPLLIDSPTSKSARNIERIARRVLAVLTSREQPSRAVSLANLVAPELSLYDVLGTHRGANDEELRRAYKKQRSIFQPDSLVLTSLLSDQQLTQEISALDEAYETLLDPLRRRAYDVSTFPAEERPPAAESGKSGSSAEAERQLLREELAREIGADTEFGGALLMKVRESLGIEIEEIVVRTKISGAYLRAIESDDYASLPALVYTRGFLQQIAKCLSLDPAQVTRTYVRRIRQASGSRGGEVAS
jgi:flagellar biosynthesis protein FlhG